MNGSDRRKRIDTLLDQVGLTGRGDHAIRGYSRGMTQRLGLAQALMNDPDILILDEPLSNLDPIGRKDVRDIILALKERGKTIFFSSHILSDAEMIADRIGIINQGKLIQVGSMGELVDRQVLATEVTFDLDPERVETLNLGQDILVRQDNRFMISLAETGQISGVLKKIDQQGGSVISVIPQRKNLEDVFMSHFSENP